MPPIHIEQDIVSGITCVKDWGFGDYVVGFGYGSGSRV